MIHYMFFCHNAENHMYITIRISWRMNRSDCIQEFPEITAIWISESRKKIYARGGIFYVILALTPPFRSPQISHPPDLCIPWHLVGRLLEVFAAPNPGWTLDSFYQIYTCPKGGPGIWIPNRGLGGIWGGLPEGLKKKILIISKIYFLTPCSDNWIATSR